MTTTSWAHGVSGDYDTAGNWTAGVPVAGDTALITTSGTYTVTSSQLNTLADLEMARHATLDVNGSSFRLTSGTATGELAGTIDVSNTGTDAGVLQLGATSSSTTFKDAGTIQLIFLADLIVAGKVTLIGNGDLALVGVGTTIGTGAFDGTLTNGSTLSGHTISGTGTIGDGSLTFVNATRGVIKADGDPDSFASQNLDVDTAGFTTNSGLMEATETGVLFLKNDVDQTATGRITASAPTAMSPGPFIVLDNASIVNGSVSIGKGTSLESVSGTDLINTTKPIANAGLIQPVDASTLILSSVRNTSTGELMAANNSRLEVAEAETGGSAVVGVGGEVFFDGAASAAVTFTGNGVLGLDDATKFTGTVAGLSSNLGAAIDLENIPFADGPVVVQSAHEFTVTDPVTHVVDKIKFVGTGNFIAHDGTGAFLGDTLISDPPTGSSVVPHADTLLSHAIAAFGAASGIAASGTDYVADYDKLPNLLAARPHQA